MTTNIQLLMLLLRKFGRVPVELWRNWGLPRGYATMSEPLVELAPGASVRGKTLNANNSPRPVYTYLGIPYAQPPVGKLRFRPPQPAKLSTGIRDATEFGAGCQQPREQAMAVFPRFPIPEKLSEDCLYLNVYTPTHDTGQARKLPVMIWIHGGSFFLGSGDVYDGRALAANHDVIVVSINYRLGIFGFLATPDGHFKGNMGLMDQVEAMKWVQKYIHKFGGDPDNVTLFGESAGSISISLHLVSPMTKGLFHKVICQSGTLPFPGNIMSKNANAGFVRSNMKPLGLSSTDGPEVEKLLAKLSSEDMVNHFPKMFPKVIDGTYLTDHPAELYRRGIFHRVPMLCGFNGHEYLVHQFIFGSAMEHTEKSQAEGFIDFSLKAMYFRGVPEADSICRKVTDHYLGDVADTDAEMLTERCRELHADCLFTAPAVLSAGYHSANSPVYMYEFRHRPHFSTGKPGMTADHTDEIHYVFGVPYASSETWPEVDKYMCNLLMAYWTNFAKHGDPNGAGLVAWPSYTTDTKRYMHLKECPEVAADYKPGHMTLWNDDIHSTFMKNEMKSKL